MTKSMCINAQLVVFKIVIGTKWQTVTLDDRPKPNSEVDTDKDGLTDWEEIDTESGLLKWTPLNPLVTFPNAWEVVEYSGKSAAFDRFVSFNGIASLSRTEVLPILSNPANKFSANDGISDYDKVKLYKTNPLLFTIQCDAIWLTESNNITVGWLGHTALLIRDRIGKWWHLSFSKGESDIPWIGNGILSGVKIKGNCIDTFMKENPQYDKTAYITGDFSASFDFLMKAKDDEDLLSNIIKFYNIFTNNCTQLMWYALSFGEVELKSTYGFSLNTQAYINAKKLFVGNNVRVSMIGILLNENPIYALSPHPIFNIVPNPIPAVNAMVMASISEKINKNSVIDYSKGWAY